MSRHDAKLAHRAPSMLTNETLATSVRVSYAAQHAHLGGNAERSWGPPCIASLAGPASSFAAASPLLAAPDRDRYKEAFRALHSPLIQRPTPPMIAITAISRIPSSTVYSISAAPSSSFLKWLT